MKLRILLLALFSCFIYFLIFEASKKTSIQTTIRKKVATKKPKYSAPEMYALIERERRTKFGQTNPGYKHNHIFYEYGKAKSRSSRARTTDSGLTFVERGPGNIAGRTRAVLFDPDDASYQTIYAGSASGGIWKTTNGGESWNCISNNLPILSTNALAMSVANTNVIYAGTGEQFITDHDGAGLFKSTNKGTNWTQIASPDDYPDFKNVSRIIVDPNNEDVVLAATRNSVWTDFPKSSIFKSTDGGTTWTKVLSSTTAIYDDLDYDPTNFNIMYAAGRYQGVVKSTDGGDTWTDASTGLQVRGRIEITVSPVNTKRLWAAAEGILSNAGLSDLYTSNDAGATWSLVVNESGINQDFFGGQGYYNNIVTAHPFNENIVFVGGVNIWKFELTEDNAGAMNTLDVSEINTSQFISLVNYGDPYLGSVLYDDLRQVEIRFGEDTQLAHRFTVNGQGAGVPANEYTYEGYEEVPFQVFDMDTGEQLMVSFRDQQEDGTWNLIPFDASDDPGDDSREYLFVHNLLYDTDPEINIAMDGGHEYQQMFFLWPYLAQGANFDPENLPPSSISVEKFSLAMLTRITTILSDAYGQYTGINSYMWPVRDEGIHPDHHTILTYDHDANAETFRLLIGNDGGVYKSLPSTSPGSNDGDFTYISHGYNTTQFYSADKAPGEDRFIGGMQDNGTWFHAEGVTGEEDVFMTFGIAGDGFESLWHPENADLLMGGSQYNAVVRTTDGGKTWVSASTGLPTGSVYAPFATRLAHHKSAPDKVYAVASSGIYKSEDFGILWSASNMNDSDMWVMNSSTDVEVSYANPDVIWTGGYLQNDRRVFISTNGGATFDVTSNYKGQEMGFVSGIGTHPSDDKIAYILFSFQGAPKVLRTIDQGISWEDISGFDGSGDRGFPDVAVNCLFVWPNDQNRIWVGTEIGIVESLDNGLTWNLFEDFVPTNVYDFKLVDNTIVIATYGRGIWSVKIDDIITATTVTAAYTTPSGNVNIEIAYNSLFDSSKVYIDDVLVSELDANATGTTSMSFQNTQHEGFVKIRVDSYLNGATYSSADKEELIFITNEQTNSYANDFNVESADFAGHGFTIEKSGDFQNGAIHSEHPYSVANTHLFYLKTPIIVDNSGATLYYKDVAIVEPGAINTVFTDQEFADYVVVEASLDGLNWLPVMDGYDALKDDRWLEAYEQGKNGSPQWFKEHEIDLLTSFTAGDEILLRFRLFSDEALNGYGWVIDDLYIQSEPPLTVVDKNAYPLLYPNPTKAFVTVQNMDIASLYILTLSGQRVFPQTVATNDSGFILDVRDLKNGIYFIGDEVSNKILKFSKK